MEPARFSFVLLVIALANLATDITRLVLELAPPRVLHESVSAQTRPQQETSVQAPEGGKPDTTQKDIALKEAKPLDQSPSVVSGVWSTDARLRREETVL